MNKNILVTVVALLLSACGSNVEINDLESSDGLSYLDGELFTGTAEELNINNQLKQTQEFDNGKLLTRLIYLDNKPLNFNPAKAQGSQNLPDVIKLNFAINILSTDLMAKKKSLVGDKPYFYKLDSIEGYDINTEFEFEYAEYLFKKFF